MVYRGQVKKGMIVLNDGATLPDGTEVSAPCQEFAFLRLEREDGRRLAPRFDEVFRKG